MALGASYCQNTIQHVINPFTRTVCFIRAEHQSACLSIVRNTYTHTCETCFATWPTIDVLNAFKMRTSSSTTFNDLHGLSMRAFCNLTSYRSDQYGLGYLWNNTYVPVVPLQYTVPIHCRAHLHWRTHAAVTTPGQGGNVNASRVRLQFSFGLCGESAPSESLRIPTTNSPLTVSLWPTSTRRTTSCAVSSAKGSCRSHISTH